MKETGLTGKRRSTTIATTPDDGNSQRKRRSPLLDNEHVRQDGTLELGQDGPGPSCPNSLYDAL